MSHVPVEFFGPPNFPVSVAEPSVFSILGGRECDLLALASRERGQTNKILFSKLTAKKLGVKNFEISDFSFEHFK